MLYVKIPKDRVGVLVGPKGQVKTQIEQSCGVALQIDSKTGDVTIIPKEEAVATGMVGLAARDIVKAIARGFSPERAMRLTKDDVYLSVIDIRDFAGKRRKHVQRVRGRVIGKKGKTRRIIEKLARLQSASNGDAAGIIGDLVCMDIAKRAVEMLLEGSEHAATYRYLEGRRRDLKFMEISME